MTQETFGATTTDTPIEDNMIIRAHDWTNQTEYQVWELSKVMDKHTTITVINGTWYGLLGTRILPKHLESLPSMTDYRSSKVREWQLRQYNLAYDLIFENISSANPRTSKCCDGMVTVKR